MIVVSISGSQSYEGEASEGWQSREAWGSITYTWCKSSNQNNIKHWWKVSPIFCCLFSHQGKPQKHKNVPSLRCGDSELGFKEGFRIEKLMGRWRQPKRIYLLPIDQSFLIIFQKRSRELMMPWVLTSHFTFPASQEERRRHHKVS